MASAAKFDPEIELLNTQIAQQWKWWLYWRPKFKHRLVRMLQGPISLHTQWLFMMRNQWIKGFASTVGEWDTTNATFQAHQSVRASRKLQRAPVREPTGCPPRRLASHSKTQETNSGGLKTYRSLLPFQSDCLTHSLTSQSLTYWPRVYIPCYEFMIRKESQTWHQSPDPGGGTQYRIWT